MELAKYILILIGMAVCASAGTVTLEFTTISSDGKYSPKHVLAAWVTDAQTNYIKTLSCYGRKRQKYLSTWQQARSGDTAVDGTTGATIASHEPLTVTWDGCDAAKKSLPDGAYLIFVEFTSAHRQGPIAVFPVLKGSQTAAKVLPDQQNFKDIKLSYTAAGK